VLGSLGGDLLKRVGARAALRGSAMLLASSLCLLAAARGSLPLVLLSGAAFGAAYNVVIAIQAIWSARVFEQRPSTGLAAVMFMLGAGLLAGPVVAGALADAAGLDTAFFGGAAVIALAALLPPREELAPGRAAPQAS
jgi:predicted MFS family arabinose efflux permease